MSRLPATLNRIAALPERQVQIVLAAYLSDAFQKKGVTLTVVGGAAVQYYTNADYTTKDLDAVLWGDDKDTVNEVMTSLGFRRTTTYRHFEHDLFPFVVEFPSSPIAVGSRHITEANLLKMGAYAVRVIRIEDILMDRIIAGVEWKSESSLAQAKLLWIKNRDRIDLKYLRDFAKSEGHENKLKDILKTSGSVPASKKRRT